MSEILGFLKSRRRFSYSSGRRRRGAAGLVPRSRLRRFLAREAGRARLRTALALALLLALAVPLSAFAAAPVNTSAPSVSGSTAEGSVLTASNGSWSNSPTSYSYQWQQCSSYSATVIADAPVGYWRMGESGSTAYDSSGYGNTGTYSASETRGTASAIGSSNGEVDKSTGFIGQSNSYVGVSSSDSLNYPHSAITLEGWVYPTSAGGSVIAKGGNGTNNEYYLATSGTTAVFGLLLGGTYSRSPRLRRRCRRIHGRF